MSAVATIETNSLLNIVERASRDPSVDVAKLEMLLALQERAVANQAKAEFTLALSAVASELEPVRRDARNSHLGTRYATLEAIDAALRPIYSKHGFSVRYGSGPALDGQVSVSLTLAHRGGHAETLSLCAPIDATGTGGKLSKTGIQAVGSAISYLRRYLLAMALNVTFFDEDDDGEASRHPGGGQHGRASPAGPDRKAVSWKDDVVAQMAQAQTEKGLDQLRLKIARNYGACRSAWPDMADEIDTAERTARERIRTIKSPDDWDTTPGPDPIAELIAEVEAMDAGTLEGLARDLEWRTKVKDLFPLDADRLQDAIEARRLELKGVPNRNG